MKVFYQIISKFFFKLAWLNSILLGRKLVLQEQGNGCQDPLVAGLFRSQSEGAHHWRVHISSLHVCVDWARTVTLEVILVRSDWFDPDDWHWSVEFTRNGISE